jgi:hypothetical protein
MDNKIKIYLGIPSTGDRRDIQLYLFRDLQERYGDRVELVIPENCIHRFGHDYARNEIVEEFLSSGCDILWFLDSDVCPPKHILDLVVVHGEKWLAAGAPYPLWMKAPGMDSQCILFTAYNGLEKNADGQMGIRMADVPKKGIEWVDALATGCLFLKREIFSKLEKPYFSFKRDPQTMRVIEGEDLGFALKLSNLGIKFFCDHGMVCKHYKTVDLLDINNYATEMSNAKVLDYDKEIRAHVSQAVQAAMKKGFEKGYEAALRERPTLNQGPITTKTGLILPKSLSAI